MGMSSSPIKPPGTDSNIIFLAGNVTGTTLKKAVNTAAHEALSSKQADRRTSTPGTANKLDLEKANLSSFSKQSGFAEAGKGGAMSSKIWAWEEAFAKQDDVEQAFEPALSKRRKKTGLNHQVAPSKLENISTHYCPGKIESFFENMRLNRALFLTGQHKWSHKMALDAHLNDELKNLTGQ